MKGAPIVCVCTYVDRAQHERKAAILQVLHAGPGAGSRPREHIGTKRLCRHLLSDKFQLAAAAAHHGTAEPR